MNTSKIFIKAIQICLLLIAFACNKDTDDSNNARLTNANLTIQAQAWDAKIISFTIDNDGFIEIEYEFFPENLILNSTGTLGSNNSLNNMGMLEYNLFGVESLNLITSISMQSSGGLNQATQQFTDLEITPSINGDYSDINNNEWHITTSTNLLFDNNGNGSYLKTDGNGKVSFSGQYLRPSDFDVYTNLSVNNQSPIEDPYKLGVVNNTEVFSFIGFGAVLQEEDGFTIKINSEFGHILRYDTNLFELNIYDQDGVNLIDEATLELVQ